MRGFREKKGDGARTLKATLIALTNVTGIKPLLWGEKKLTLQQKKKGIGGEGVTFTKNTEGQKAKEPGIA